MQVDSMCAFQLLSGRGTIEHQHAALITCFHQLKSRNWYFQIDHYREANVVADFLAMDHTHPHKCHILSASNSSLSNWILYD
ncbi:hypothetical protein LINPERHAP2_LOCUS5564 [Linum perenne]